MHRSEQQTSVPSGLRTFSAAVERSRGTGPRATKKKRFPFLVGRGPSHATRACERVSLAIVRAHAIQRSRGTGPRATGRNRDQEGSPTGKPSRYETPSFKFSETRTRIFVNFSDGTPGILELFHFSMPMLLPSRAAARDRPSPYGTQAARARRTRRKQALALRNTGNFQGCLKLPRNRNPL